MPDHTMNGFSARKRVIAAAISACFISAPAWGNPTAPQVINGSASFNQAGKLLTVTNSPGAIINWNSFSIDAAERTRFNQTSAASSVLNRVVTNEPSVLLGTLSSNGKLWLVNPAGILVGQGAKIDVAGFIASTLNVRNQDFLAGRLNFGATPNAGSIQNYGQISTPSGGSVYLIAPAVDNHGIISAVNGEIMLAAGQTAQLVDTGTPGVKVEVTGSQGSAINLGEIVAAAGRIGLAGVLVKNSGTLNASSVVKAGGRIFLKASKDAYVDGAGRIVTTGTKGGSIEVLGGRVTVAEQAVIDASGTEQGGGHVLLKADMSQGLTTVAGSLLATGGAQGGDGGFIETSGAHVKIADSARVNSSAPKGKAGTWLIDPTDYTIANSNGDITPATLSTNLYGGNVTIETADGGAGYGDIYVNDGVSWTSTNTFSLNAHRNINVNATISNGVGGSLVLRADKTGTGTGTVTFNQYGGVSLYGSGRTDLYYNPTSYSDTSTRSDTSGNPYSSKIGGTYTAWMLVNSVGQESGGTVGLQAMDTNRAGNYALGKNIDASATVSWNSGAGFAPVGTNSDSAFSGSLDGLNHTITGLSINRSTTDYGGDYVGLFGYALSSSAVHNVGLVGGSMSGHDHVGALVGNYAYSAGPTYSISNSYATTNVTGNIYVGGLVGSNGGSITNSYAAGSVSSASYGGGLVGYGAYGGSVSNSYAAGSVTGTSNVGGLVGYNAYGGGSPSNSFWDTQTSGQADLLDGRGTGRTTAQMMTQATFSDASWDIANTGSSGKVWRIYQGATYPLLTSFLTPLTITATSGSRVYDATDAGIGVSYSATPVMSKVLGTLSYSGASKNVGSYSPVMPGGLYSDQQGYDISYSSGAVTINPKPVNLSGSRVYDASANVAAGTLSIGTLVGSETLTLSGSGSVSDKNVGSNKPIALGSIALGDGSNGGLASNYTFTGGTQTINITKAALTVSASGANKVYDATTNASVTLGDNRLGSDVLTLGYGAASFNDKNVGTAKPVSVSGIAVSGSDAGNYAFNTTATTSADITKAALAVSASGANKVYDATTNASVTLGDNRLGSDVLTLGYGAASFNDKNVGTGKPVSVSGIAVSGTDAGNYAFNTTATTSADIAKAALAVSASGANKVYDATTNASVTLGDNRLGSDILTLGYGAASFNDKNVGAAKPVSVSGIAVSGTDAGNYTFNTTATTSADITKAALTVSASGANKVYDATTNASVTLGDNRLGSDILTLGYGAASFNDKNVGTAKPVSVSGITVSGTDAGNYTFNTTATTGADITPRALSVSAAGVNKVYDGLTTATVTYTDSRLAGDVLGVGGNASYLDKNVDTAKQVNVSGIALTGADAGNYALGNTSTVTTADITVRPLSTWIGSSSGNWSVAANWDALPDLSNVLAATIPAGKTVTYDAAAGTTNLTTLSAGGLIIAGGSLNVANNLTISSHFAQTGGTLGDFAGGSSANITQASGNLNLPAITVASLSLNAPAGTITQSGRIAALTLTTQSQGATTLTNPDNQISNRVDMAAGGPLKLWASGDLNLGTINAGTNAVEIKAGGAILKAPGTETGTNITAGAADLASMFGGTSGNLAISADTQVTGALAASVGPAADFGGIRIKNTGAQPTSVTLSDNALAGAGVSFLNTGDLSSTSGFNLATLKGGDLALLSNGNITWDGGSLSTPTGSVLISADGNVNVSGALSAPVDLALSSKTAISISGSVSTAGTGTAAFTAPSMSNSGTINSADDVGMIANSINFGAGSSIKAGHDVIFAAGNVTAANSVVSAAHDISAAVTGDMRLNGSNFTAGNDIFINMMGADSTLYLNDTAGLPQSFLWAKAPSTIHLDFPARASGGVVVDGVAVDPLKFATAVGGSGLFYGAAMAPATPGTGLHMSYSVPLPEGDTGTTAELTVMDAVVAAISSVTTTTTQPSGATPPPTPGAGPGQQTGSGGPLGSDQTVGGTEGSFGGSDGTDKDKEEAKDKDKKDTETGLKKEADKPTTKKLSTCR